MKVNEIFSSLQGEGLFMGRPTTFIRLQGCNQACVWCDTKYALDDVYTDMDTRDIIKVVSGLGNSVVDITGGEPLVQDIDDLVEMLYAKRHIIMVETNGTILPSPTCRDLVNSWNISPKLPSSENKIKRDELERFVKYINIKMNFKFVVSDEADIEYLLSLIDIVQDYPIFITPVWTTEGDWSESKYLCKLTKLYSDTANNFRHYNVRYTPQLHHLLGVR